MKITFSYIFLFAKDCRPMTSEWQGASYFRRYGRGQVSKPAISSHKSWGGYRSKIHTRKSEFSAGTTAEFVGRGRRRFSKYTTRTMFVFRQECGVCGGVLESENSNQTNSHKISARTFDNNIPSV